MFFNTSRKVAVVILIITLIVIIISVIAGYYELAGWLGLLIVINIVWNLISALVHWIKYKRGYRTVEEMINEAYYKEIASKINEKNKQ